MRTLIVPLTIYCDTVRTSYGPRHLLILGRDPIWTTSVINGPVNTHPSLQPIAGLSPLDSTLHCPLWIADSGVSNFTTTLNHQQDSATSALMATPYTIRLAQGAVHVHVSCSTCSDYAWSHQQVAWLAETIAAELAKAKAIGPSSATSAGVSHMSSSVSPQTNAHKYEQL